MNPAVRPLVHFSCPQGWLNDPNGLVWHHGEYHLFYQHHPHSTVWGPMHWGHAVTTDLVTWDHQPIALEPVGSNGIFSGCIVEDEDNTSGLVPGGGLVAVFSFQSQDQGLAFSTDRGRTWTPYAGNPVLPAQAHDFRDPKVFFHEGAWRMVLAAGDRLEFYKSPNLKDWTSTGAFRTDLNARPWECPDLFPLTWGGVDRWVLVVSVGAHGLQGGSGVLVWIGDYDGAAFRPEFGPDWLDGGPDHYASATWSSAPEGRRLLIGWMNDWRYAAKTPEVGWRGLMSLPRDLSLGGRDRPRLVQRPADEVMARRQVSRPLARGEAADGLALGRLAPASDLVFTLEAGAGAQAELKFKGPGTKAFSLVWDRRLNTLALDRRQAGEGAFHEAFPGVFTVSLKDPGPILLLRMVIDGTCVEVFAEGGLTVLSALIYPPPGTVWTLGLEARAGRAVCGGGTVWTLG